jgi:hypothetical protein
MRMATNGSPASTRLRMRRAAPESSRAILQTRRLAGRRRLVWPIALAHERNSLAAVAGQHSALLAGNISAIIRAIRQGAPSGVSAPHTGLRE